MDLNKISNFIKTKRKELGMTQEELAEKLFVTEKAISRWETGRGTPDISLLLPLSKVLKVEVSELLVGKESKKKINEMEKLLEYNEMKRTSKYNFTFYLIVVFYILSILSFLIYLRYEYNPNIWLNYFLRLFIFLMASIFIIIGNRIYCNHYVEKVEDKRKIMKLSQSIIFIYYIIFLFNMVLFARYETVTNCNALKLKAKDGKYRLTDVVDIEGMFRIIESIPSKNAEPIKQWLAKLGSERIDETFDPSIVAQRAIDLYREKGYDEKWIAKRMKGIQDRKELTDVWQEGGIVEGKEYAILTNEIYKEWFGMTAKEYKQYKGLRKESLRDNMDSMEVILTDLSEETTKRLAKRHKPQGLEQNKEVARMGGHAAKVARDDIEKNLGESVVTKDNRLNYEYMNEKQIETK